MVARAIPSCLGAGQRAGEMIILHTADDIVRKRCVCFYQEMVLSSKEGRFWPITLLRTWRKHGILRSYCQVLNRPYSEPVPLGTLHKTAYEVSRGRGDTMNYCCMFTPERKGVTAADSKPSWGPVCTCADHKTNENAILPSVYQ